MSDITEKDEGVAISISSAELIRWEDRLRELGAEIRRLHNEEDWLAKRLQAARYILEIQKP